MMDCKRLSDRMPDVALGRAAWTAEETRHLGGCPICQQEWEIVRLAGRLGRGMEERFEPDQTSRAVLQRLRSAAEAGRRRQRRWSVAGLAAAAAIVVAVWAGRTEYTADSAPAATSLAAGRPAFPLPELESLQPAELDSVLRTMDEPSLSSTAEDPDLTDLSPDELERVLDSWEG